LKKFAQRELKVRFDAVLHQDSLNYDQIRRVALKSESLGYKALLLNDHLISPIVPFSRTYLECWIALSALATATSSIRLGPLVTCNLFRSPSLIAKMAATLDNISGGRLEFGIGAGWFGHEMRSYGMLFPNVYSRVKRLEESIAIIKLLWTRKESSFTGQYYRLRNAICEPKPMQKPHPPIWVGVLHGKRPMLKVAAKYADVLHIAYLHTPEDASRIIFRADQECISLGRDPRELVKAYQPVIFMAETKQEVRCLIKQMAERFRLSINEFQQSIKGAIIGTPDVCVEKLKEYAAIGITRFTLDLADIENLSVLSLFARHVIPAFAE